LKRFSNGSPLEISNEALDFLTAYYWPGNIRELQNAVERLVVLNQAERIECQHLPTKLRTATSSKRSQVIELPAEGYPL